MKLKPQQILKLVKRNAALRIGSLWEWKVVRPQRERALAYFDRVSMQPGDEFTATWDGIEYKGRV